MKVKDRRNVVSLRLGVNENELSKESAAILMSEQMQSVWMRVRK